MQVTTLTGAKKNKQTAPLSILESILLATWSTPTAQIIRLANGWEVSHKKVDVVGYHENLGQDTTLPMVLIPGGEFVMGSPSSEPERSSNEGPQHSVTLAEFWLGQTPITRAQWREVAGWQERKGEKWARQLTQDPSRFKATDNLEEKVY